LLLLFCPGWLTEEKRAVITLIHGFGFGSGSGSGSGFGFGFGREVRHFAGEVKYKLAISR